jgi:hypothetical protein
VRPPMISSTSVQVNAFCQSGGEEGGYLHLIVCDLELFHVFLDPVVGRHRGGIGRCWPNTRSFSPLVCYTEIYFSRVVLLDGIGASLRKSNSKVGRNSASVKYCQS